MKSLFPPSKFTFSVNGRDIIVQRVAGGKNRPPKLVVTVKGQFGGRLLIRFENGWDRFCKQIGLNREPQVPDRQANDELYFECDDQEFVNRVFLGGDLRTKILDLLTQGFIIDIQPNKCVFTKPYGFERFDESGCEQLAKSLAAFTMPLPSSSETAGDATRFHIFKILLLTIGYATAALAVATLCLSLVYPVAESALCWRYASQFFGPAILIAVVMGFGAIRGFATSSKVYTSFVLSFCIGAVVLSYFGTQYVNGKYDQGTSSSFTQPVIHKYTTTSKNSTTYHVDLAPWRDGGSRYSFTVGSGTYAGITVGSTKYIVTTRPGALGIEWVVGYKKSVDHDRVAVDITWPPRDFSRWNPLPHVPDIDPAEMVYWQQWAKIMETGITNRMNVHNQLNDTQRHDLVARIRNEYWRRQSQMLEQLSQLQPPERLRSFHETVVSAGHDQIEFYVDFGNAKEDQVLIKFENVSNNQHLKESDQKLWAAYHQFEALYPQRSKTFNDSIEQRLCWFDII